MKRFSFLFVGALARLLLLFPTLFEVTCRRVCICGIWASRPLGCMSMMRTAVYILGLQADVCIRLTVYSSLKEVWRGHVAGRGLSCGTDHSQAASYIETNWFCCLPYFLLVSLSKRKTCFRYWGLTFAAGWVQTWMCRHWLLSRSMDMQTTKMSTR